MYMDRIPCNLSQRYKPRKYRKTRNLLGQRGAAVATLMCVESQADRRWPNDKKMTDGAYVLRNVPHSKARTSHSTYAYGMLAAVITSGIKLYALASST